MSVLGKISLLKETFSECTLVGAISRISSWLVNYVIKLTCLILNRFIITPPQIGSLKFPYPSEVTEKYCFAAESEEDWMLVGLFKKHFKTGELFVASSLPPPHSSHRGITQIPYESIVENNFRTVVIPSPAGESTIERNLRKLNHDTGHLFSIWDPHNYFKTHKYLQGKMLVTDDGFVPHRYGDIELWVSPGNTILPSYYPNWGYVNYLLANEIKDGISVLDMWAGSGVLGFFCKSRSNISVSFADINYFAILSMKMTMEKNPSLKGEVWLSDVFENIPETERFDLIIGNPPCGRGVSANFIRIGGADNEWRSHMSFFANVTNYLNENGRICIVEQICNVKEHTVEFAENFYREISNHFPELKVVDIKPLPGTFLSVVTVERRK